MKAVLITYNQALNEKINDLLDRLFIRGFTQWTDVMGRGSKKGEPHMGTHTWPALNSSILTILADDKADVLLNEIKKINKTTEQQGLRAFVWDIEKTV